MISPVPFRVRVVRDALRYLSAEGEYLLAGYRCDGGGCGNGQVLYFSEDGTGDALARGCVGRTNYAIEDQAGRIWFGDDWMGFRWLDNINDEVCNTFEIDSPGRGSNYCEIGTMPFLFLCVYLHL